MKFSIARLHKLMGEVADFLRFAGNMERLRTSPPTSGLNVSREVATYLASPTWRRHTYAFSIVSVYGAHERFVRDFVDEAAGALSTIYESYSRLPEKLRREHERLSIDRARDILDGKGGSHADFRLGLSNLHACLDGSMSINRDVFSSATANYRSHLVRDIVARLGVDLPSPDTDASLCDTLTTELNGVYSTISGVVDDLADRRNEIAHGSDYQILDLGTLSSIFKAVYEYDCWVCVQVARSLLRTAVLERGVDLGCVAKTYTAADTMVRSIASITDVSQSIRANEVLYLLHGGMVQRVVVKSIQKEKVEVASAEPGEGPYGVDFSIAVKDKSRVLRLPAKHSNLATALDLAIAAQPEGLTESATLAAEK